MPAHLFVDLSAHGFGHVAQTAPVINALYQRVPGLYITVRGTFPAKVLRTRILPSFHHLPDGDPIGMVMGSAVDVLVAESHCAYRHFHAGWSVKVEREAAFLRQLAPDLVLSNVPYLSLTAAARAGIPAIALSSLNWADIYHHYCGHLPGAAAIGTEIREAYSAAQVFLRIEPGLPMTDRDNLQVLGPIAALGCQRRAELERVLRLADGKRVVLIALGGVDTRLPTECWPTVPGVTWLVPNNWHSRRDDVVPFERVPMPFLDLLASSDAVLTKPGYGTFVEAACNGIPVLCMKRPDWPESPHLTRWLADHGTLVELDREQILAGDMLIPLTRLLARPRPGPVVPRGVDQAAALLASMLGG